MVEIEDVLDKNEKIVWRGKPKFWPFVLSNLIFVFIGLIFFGFSLFVVSSTGNMLFLLLPHFWLGVLVAVGPLTYSVFVHRYMEYVITDRRILIKKGIIGRDFDTVDFEKLQDLSVDVGLLDKIFGTGTVISFTMSMLGQSTGGNPIPGTLFKSIENPYDVYKLLKGYAFNVKTDIYYPNKYRPADNPGYNTKYSQKK